jgi:multidrug efflux pump subunit AcrA (membrane-fusion protein)
MPINLRDQTTPSSAPASAIAAPEGGAQLWNVIGGHAADPSSFHAAWLALQCGMISGTTAGLLLLRGLRPAGELVLTPIAAWPDSGRELKELAHIGERAAQEGRSVAAWARGEGALVPQSLATAIVAHPIGGGAEGPYAVVVVAVAPRAGMVDPQAVARQLQWGAGWLETHGARAYAQQSARKVALAAAGLDLVALAGEHRRLNDCAIAVANALAQRLDCERVSIGLVDRRGNGIKLQAVSHTATMKRSGALIDAIENAMEEALDQNATVLHPGPAAGDRRIAIAHRQLVQASEGRCAVMSVVIAGRGRPLGVITLERHRDAPFDAEAVNLAEVVATLLGPLVALQRDADRWVAGRALDATLDGARALVGPRRPGLKLAAIGVAALLALMGFVRGEHRISAKAVTEGVVQRAAVAPFEGFIKRAPVRAGDTVRAGDLLAALDDKDLVLDRLRLKGERDKLAQKYRDALAKHDRPAMAVLAPQMEQAEAQLALATDKLDRAQVTAPFDGIIVSGDLSQSLGAPIEKGKVLFEIAPLNAYRLILQVDERDIRHVRAGESGRIALTGLPEQALPVRVERVTPVAVAEEGRNYFRVEASLEAGGAQLRPGMEGIAKVEAGEARLIWVWTYPVIDWLRLTAWKWLP